MRNLMKDYHFYPQKPYIFNMLLLSVIVVLGGIIGFFVTLNSVVIFFLVLALFVFVFLARNPELAVALQFSGTIFYFYAMFKLGIVPQRMLTAGFHIFLISAYLLGGIYLKLKTRRTFRFNSIDILFFMLFLWVFVSFFLYFSGSESATKKILFAPFLIIAPYCGVQLFSSEQQVKRFFIFCVLLPTIMIVPSLYELFFNPVFSNIGRFAPFVFRADNITNPHVFATAYADTVLILLIKTFEGHRGSKFMKSAAIIIIAASVFFVLRSGARSQLLNLILILFVYFALMSKMNIRRKIALVIVIIAIFLKAYSLVPERMTNFYALSQQTDSASVVTRFELYKGALNDFMDNPLLGVGTGNSDRGVGFPHNIILEVASELGILGLIIFFSMCYVTVYKATAYMKSQKNTDTAILMKISLMLFVYAMLVLMYSDRLVTTIWFFVPVSIISFLSKHQDKNKGPVLVSKRNNAFRMIGPEKSAERRASAGGDRLGPKV